MKVFIWSPVKKGQNLESNSSADLIASRNHFGHASCQLSDGFYISIWPTEVLGHDMPISRSQYVQLTDDIEAEERQPDITYLIPFPVEAEEKVKEKFHTFKHKKYSLLNHNCCNVVVMSVKTAANHCSVLWEKEFKSFTPRKLSKRLNWKNDINESQNEIVNEIKSKRHSLISADVNKILVDKLKEKLKMPHHELGIKFRPWTPKALDSSLKNLTHINGKKTERIVREGFTDIIVGSTVFPQPTIFSDLIDACESSDSSASIVNAILECSEFSRRISLGDETSPNGGN